jgi:hypothetical protein
LKRLQVPLLVCAWAVAIYQAPQKAISYIGLASGGTILRPSRTPEKGGSPSATGTISRGKDCIARLEWRGPMFIQRISRFSIIAAFCSASLMFVTQATSALSHSSTRPTAESLAQVNRTAKADRLARAREVQSSANAIAIELTGLSDVVIRDRRGFVLFAVDHSGRTTIVGKQGGGRVTLPAAPAQAHEAVPEGCEGAFSPYVEPSKAHILGRCLLSISESGKAVS